MSVDNVSAASEYSRLTLKLAWCLAAPHTWAASIMPVLLAIAFSCARGYAVSVITSFVLLVIAVLLQSAVNTLNDYFDYVKGADSADDNVEVDDAVLVYNNIRPQSARNLAIAFVGVAFALGIYCIWLAGWVPLVIALVGIATIFLYSGGMTPISYLPIGEAASGVVMGMLITFASSVVLTRTVEWLVLAWSVPLALGIALIMLTNNTCDIEKDISAKRRTLPVLLGRARAMRLYQGLVIAWLACIALIVAIWYTGGLLFVPFMVFAAYPLAKALVKNPKTHATRIPAMSAICSLNVVLGAFYAIMVVASTMTLSV